MNTTHFIVNLFMSKVYNESCFKRNQHVSFTFVYVDLYALYIMLNCTNLPMLCFMTL